MNKLFDEMGQVMKLCQSVLIPEMHKRQRARGGRKRESGNRGYVEGIGRVHVYVCRFDSIMG